MSTRDGGIPGNAGENSGIGARVNSHYKKGVGWQGITAADIAPHVFKFWIGPEERRLTQAEAEAEDYLERMGN